VHERYDVVVIGAGPGGSATSMLLAERGLSVLVVDRDRFPRYHIGESLTGTAGDFMARHGLEDDMRTWGFLQKPGVKVIGREAKHEFYVPVLRPTWQVRRAEFDELLLRRAVERGAEYAQASVQSMIAEAGRAVGVVLSHDGEERREIRCSMLVDASGQSSFLSRQGVAGPRRVEAFNRQIALYSQYEGVEVDAGELENVTVIFYRDIHHWSWLIPLTPTTVSIGVVLPINSYKLRGGSAESVMQWGLQELNPELARRCRAARQTEPMRVTRNYSYRVEPFVGPGWLCVGDAHRFTDPIFSFGVSFALTEAEAAAEAIVTALREPGREPDVLASYASYCTRGHDRAADLIRFFWKFPPFFSYMTRSERGGDIIRLLAGDCFSVEPLGASVEMKKSIEDFPQVERVPEGRPRDIACRVYQRFDSFQGVDAAFLVVNHVEITVYFILTESNVDLYDSLQDFEDGIVADFGRDDLAIFSYTPDLLDAMPPTDGMLRIFDRRGR
jgi:1H-pyrrole-2-carbonyl-[peptidyl-carrier protein] brominase